MKRLFKKKKKSASEVGSLASGRSASGYEVSPKKDLVKLHKAAFEGDLTKLKSLLKKGDVNELDKENRTPLHLACANGKIDAVRMIVNHPHCNLNLCDNDRRSALMKCVQCQFQNCMDILLRKDADVTLSDTNGNTALHLATSIPSYELCNLLLDYSADVHGRNKDDSTPLHLAASVNDSNKVIRILLDDGAQINAVDSGGKTPLMLSASRGFIEEVKLMLESGANATIRDKRGWTADDYASMNGHHPISHIIVEHSVRQRNEKSKISTTNHEYDSVPQTSKSNLHYANNADGSEESELDLEDSNLSGEKDSLPSGTDEDFTPQVTEPPKPKVNVAQFLKQRQQQKDKMTPTTSVQGHSSDSDEELETRSHLNNQPANPHDDEDIKDPASNDVRPRGYASNSRKGGQVSPAKPPLPVIRSSGSLTSSPAVTHSPPEAPQDENDDSPWDSEDDEEDLPQPKQTQSTSNFNKPNQSMMAQLGLSEDDLHNIYDNPSDESIDFSSPTIQSKNETNKKSETPVSANKIPKLDESDEDEDTSSWDDDASDKQSPSATAATNFLATSSVIKFDDELSENEQEIPAIAPTNELKNVGVIIDSDESSSWDSDHISENPIAVKSNVSPFKAIVANDGNVQKLIKENVEDESGDETTESESSWEVENRKNRAVASSSAKPYTNGINRDEVDAHEESKRKQVEKHHLEEERRAEEQMEESVEDSIEIASIAQRNAHKALAVEAARKVKQKEEKKEKEERKKRREEEDHQHHLATQDRENMETALYNALNASANHSDSEASELDDSYIGNADRLKNMDARTSSIPVPTGGFTHAPSSNSKLGKKRATKSRVHVNGNDPSNWTGTETETDVDDDALGNVPNSLRSSQLSESLLRSGERGELEREAVKEKRRAVDAIEQLDFAQRSIEQLQHRIAEYKSSEDEWMKTRDEQEATIRKLNFEHNRLEEQLSSSDLELQMARDRIKRIDEQLELESTSRRKQEVTIRELRNELKNSDKSLKMIESERDKLKNEQHKVALQDQVTREKEKINREIHDESTSSSILQVEALNLIMNEKDQELIRIKAERDALQDSCNRYKDELSKWHSGNDNNLMGKLNQDLNERVQELTRDLRESEEALQHAALQFNMQLNNIKQANEAVTEQLKKERVEKENILHDLEVFNDQQRVLKRHIEDLESKNRREEEKSTSLEREVKDLREKKEEAERKLHTSEVTDNHTQQEAYNLRANLAHKESLLVQTQRDKDEIKENLRRKETEWNELQRENAKLLGRIEMLQADVTQQEAERMRLRRELEDSRNFGNTSLTSHQGKLSEIMTGHQKERIEIEKVNAKLNQQVAHLQMEVKRINDEKMKRDEELSKAQQDRIETHKHLSFTESSMKQLEEDKTRLKADLEATRVRCASLEHRSDELNRLVNNLRDELETERQACNSARRDVQSFELNRTHDVDNLHKLQDRLKDAELTNERLQTELASSTSRERNTREDHDVLRQSRKQLEELIAKLQEEKLDAEEQLKSESTRCRMLQAEADGHRQMWEGEVKARSKLSVEFAKADKERRDSIALADAYRDKLTKSSTQGKSYKTKYENQRKHRSNLERHVESYSKAMMESRVRSETSESECESRLSRMSDQFENERFRLDETIRELQVQVSTLGRRLSQESEARNAAEEELGKFVDMNRVTNDSSVLELERERDQLRKELRRSKSRDKPHDAQAIANAEVNSKLDQVNNWLEERAIAQEVLERLRCENEEKRVSEANRRVDVLQREVDALRRRLATSSDDSRVNLELQKTVRDKIELQENLERTKAELEKSKAKLSHERNKYKSLHASAISGAIAGNIGSGIASHPFHTSPSFMTSSPTKLPNDVMSSTPRKDSEPVLTHLRNKLDLCIAHKLADGRSSASPNNDAQKQRRFDDNSTNEYLLIP